MYVCMSMSMYCVLGYRDEATMDIIVKAMFAYLVSRLVFAWSLVAVQASMFTCLHHERGQAWQPRSSRDTLYVASGQHWACHALVLPVSVKRTLLQRRMTLGQIGFESTKSVPAEQLSAGGVQGKDSHRRIAVCSRTPASPVRAAARLMDGAVLDELLPAGHQQW